MNWKHLAAVVILAGSVLAQIPVGAKQVPCPVQIEGKVYGINFLRPLSDTATCEQLTTIFHEQIIAQLKQQGLLGATAANPNPRKRTLPPPAPTPEPTGPLRWRSMSTQRFWSSSSVLGFSVMVYSPAPWSHTYELACQSLHRPPNQPHTETHHSPSR